MDGEPIRFSAESGFTNVHSKLAGPGQHPVLSRKDRMGTRVERVGFAWQRATVTRC
jgi:hypothetical protein